jgi:hypothetical protein
MFFYGKANIKNLCRYGNIKVRTTHRQIQKHFNFNRLNCAMLKSQGILEHKIVAAMDCSFLKKSGQKTENIGYFYDSNQGKTVTGLEISGLALIDLDQNTAYTLYCLYFRYKAFTWNNTEKRTNCRDQNCLS